MKPLIF